MPALIVGLLAAVVAFEVASSGSENAAKPSPPLPTAVLQGPPATLATLRGRPALVNFWASWCGPCREEAPALERVWRSLDGTATVVGVDFDDRRGAAFGFIRSHRLTYPMLSDPAGTSGPRFGFSGLPVTVVLDARGRIVETLRGPQSEAELRAALELARRESG